MYIAIYVYVCIYAYYHGHTYQNINRGVYSTLSKIFFILFAKIVNIVDVSDGSKEASDQYGYHFQLSKVFQFFQQRKRL